MVALGEDKLTEAIKTIGLYRGKAKNVIALSKILIEQHGGKVPKDREALEALPGVGRKTANVVLNVAFGEPTIAVDTHIFRVSNRTGLAPGKNVRGGGAEAGKGGAGHIQAHAHHWLILHGRYTCVARKPLCPTCVVRDLCRFKDKTKEAAVGKAAFETQERLLSGEARKAVRHAMSAALCGAMRQGLDMAHRQAARHRGRKRRGRRRRHSATSRWRRPCAQRRACPARACRLGGTPC